MGAGVSKIWHRLIGKQEMRIIMLGLDDAGKTTVLYKLKLGQIYSTIPTIGFNVENVQYKNIVFTVWDVGGQDKIRELWKRYYQGTQGIVFVVDSHDRARFNTARGELVKLLLHEPDLVDAVVLILANKQDLPDAMSASDMEEHLGLDEMSQRQWHVQPSCAITGEGLYEGLDWLSVALASNPRRSTTMPTANHRE